MSGPGNGVPHGMTIEDSHHTVNETVDSATPKPLNNDFQENRHRTLVCFEHEIAFPEHRPVSCKCFVRPPFPQILVFEHVVDPERPWHSLVIPRNLETASWIDSLVFLHLVNKLSRKTLLCFSPKTPFHIRLGRCDVLIALAVDEPLSLRIWSALLDLLRHHTICRCGVLSMITKKWRALSGNPLGRFGGFQEFFRQLFIELIRRAFKSGFVSDWNQMLEF
jgi:hypothetical protein